VARGLWSTTAVNDIAVQGAVPLFLYGLSSTGGRLNRDCGASGGRPLPIACKHMAARLIGAARRENAVVLSTAASTLWAGFIVGVVGGERIITRARACSIGTLFCCLASHGCIPTGYFLARKLLFEVHTIRRTYVNEIKK